MTVMVLGCNLAFSGTIGPNCKAVDVSLPCEGMAWDLGARGLYMKASTPTGYGQNTIVQNTSSLTTGVNPAWGMGFQLESAYHYSTGNDFNVNWYHYRAGGQINTLASPVTISHSSLIFPNTTSLTTQDSQTSVSPAWDQVNMEFAHHFDFGEHKFARLHAGANFSRVANAGYQYTYQTDAGATFYQKTINFNSDFNGFGPRVGLDLNYEWNNGLGVYGTGALSLLAGSAKSSHTIRNWLPINGVVNADGYLFALHQSKVIPELDAKLGAMYTYVMPQGDLSVDIGWMWAYYTNTLFRGEKFLESRAQIDGFGIQGLYFGLKWVNNVP